MIARLLDRQHHRGRAHRHLFQLSNDLHEAMLQGKGQDHVRSTIASLVHYTIQHFKSEEELMRARCYPRLVEHKNRHDEITGRVRQLAAEYSGGKTVSSVTLSELLSTWLTHHIVHVDKEMIDFLSGPRQD